MKTFLAARKHFRFPFFYFKCVFTSYSSRLVLFSLKKKGEPREDLVEESRKKKEKGRKLNLKRHRARARATLWRWIQERTNKKPPVFLEARRLQKASRHPAVT